jgi:hypothetical protein
LEQRVDSLIDLLAANGQTANANSTLPVLASTTPDTSPEAVLHSNEPIHGTKHYITPVETPDNALPGDPPPTRTYYDPIEDGVIDHVSASLLLDEFRDHCVHSFPFVVVPQTTDVDTLRGRLPFLFLAIMAVMTYRQPPIQRKLGEIFKHQIAVRIIDQAHQSLEILEGLLVYAAWYHSFYRPQTQQLSAILQLSLAMVQDLGLAKNPKDKPRKGALFEDCGVLFKVERSTAEWRALLGTYYLNVASVPTVILLQPY